MVFSFQRNFLREEKVDGGIHDENNPENNGGNMEGFFRSPFFELSEIVRSRRYGKTVPFRLNEDKKRKKNAYDDLDDEKYFKHKSDITKMKI